MGFKDDLVAKVVDLAFSAWPTVPDARVIPKPEDLTYANSGEHLDVTILYADIAGSTSMVDSLEDTLAAEYYSAFLHCASRIITRNDGEIQAYDGDRVMAVYVGDGQADNAVSTALELHSSVVDIINPTFLSAYEEQHRQLKFTVGVDTGKCLAIKVGTRGVGEIAWIGGAANYAAKLNSFDGLDHAYPIRVTAQTFGRLTQNSLYAGGAMMWQGEYNNLATRLHYRTNYKRSIGA